MEAKMGDIIEPESLVERLAARLYVEVRRTDAVTEWTDLHEAELNNKNTTTMRASSSIGRPRSRWRSSHEPGSLTPDLTITSPHDESHPESHDEEDGKLSCDARHQQGELTGFIDMEGSMAGKWLELLKEVAPLC
jgi:hypothetical protein